MSYGHGVLFPICKGSLCPGLSFAPSDCSTHHMLILHDSFSREKGLTCQINSACLTRPPWDGQGKIRIKIKKKKLKNCLLLVDQWNTVSLLHSIGFEFINENECGEVLGRNWRKRKEIHLPNIIKRSKVFSVIDFF